MEPINDINPKQYSRFEKIRKHTNNLGCVHCVSCELFVDEAVSGITTYEIKKLYEDRLHEGKYLLLTQRKTNEVSVNSTANDM
jgi:hypothetical protein